jgi:hypothetical protein
MAKPSGWYTDPTGRYIYRYWNGAQWTDQVSTGGRTITDAELLSPSAVTTPPAPGTEAPKASDPPPAPKPAPAPAVQVSQSSGGSNTTGIIIAVLAVIAIVVLIFVLMKGSGDDTKPDTTNAPVATTVAPPATTVAPPATTVAP